MAKGQHASNYRHVSALLRQMREEAKLTQRDLATRLKRAQTWVHKSEIGERRVDVSEFLDWCVGCGVKADEAITTLMKARR